MQSIVFKTFHWYHFFAKNFQGFLTFTKCNTCIMKVKIQWIIIFLPSLCFYFKIGRLNKFSAKVLIYPLAGRLHPRQRQESLLFTENTHGSHHLAGQDWCSRTGSCPSCCVSELLKGDIQLQNVFSGLQFAAVALSK